MCCESCPEYEKCAINGNLKENCCKICPDYHSCYGNNREDDEVDEEWDE